MDLIDVKGNKINPLTIIVSDGIHTVLVSDGNRISGIERLSFQAEAFESVTLSLDFSSLCRPNVEADMDFVKSAAKQLGYELRPE